MEELIVLSAMVLYLIIAIGIGFAYAKTANENTDNYFLGGRSLGPFVTAMSAEASDMSGWLLMGLPGVAYFFGLSDAFWTALGLGVGTYLNWLLTAKRLRIYSHIAEDSITIPDYFSRRFQEERPKIMTICALFILVFFTVYASSCFVTVGKLFSSIFGFNYQMMMILGAIFVVIYTYLGGFLAESVSDFMQSVVMIIALACTIVFGIHAAGGLEVVKENLKHFPGFLEFFQMGNPVMVEGSQQITNGIPQFGTPKPYGFFTILSTLSWGLGYFGVPQVLLRFMAIRHAKEITLSRRIATIWVVISLFIAVWIGLVGRYLYPSALGNPSDAESVFILLSNKLMPPFIAGVMMAGILAATMSSSDSYLLIASSAFAKNLYQGIFRREARDFEVMRVSKITLTFIAVIAVLLALDEDSVIFQIVSFAWAGFGATFGPIMIVSLFWREATKEGAFAGIITGGAMVFIWKLFLKPLGGIFEIYELLPAFLISLLVIIVVSKMTPKDPKVLALFDQYQQEVKAHKDF